MPIPSSLLSEWTREEAAQHAARTVVVLPVGALEQHGPHLPLGTDTLLAEHIARAAAADLPDAVVAPVFAYGCSHHHLPFGGTASLDTGALLAGLGDLVDSLLVSGFAGVFLLNGHGGNAEIVQLVARDVGLRRQACVAGGSYFQTAANALVAAGATELGELPGHAGAFETSLMLAAYPHLVRLDAAPKRPRPEAGWPQPRTYRLATPGPFRGGDGFSDDPSGGSAERGAQLLAICVDAVRVALSDFQRAIKASAA
ncbi:creatininase family protein [Streptomyces sp. NPDC000880]